MFSPPLDRLQKIADYRTTCKHLRRQGTGGIVLGGIFLYLGVVVFDGGPFGYVYLGLAVFELLIGLKNRFRPSAFGLVIDGGTLIVLSVWNLAWHFVWWRLGNGISLAAVDMAIACIGVRRLVGYSRAFAAFEKPPTPEQLEWFDELCAEIQSGKAADTPNLIEFRAGLRWKGMRLGELIVFVDRLDQENLIVEPGGIAIHQVRKALLSGNFQARMRIGRKSFGSAEFSPDMLARLESWLSADEQRDAAEFVE